MKKSRFNEAQIIGVLREQEAGSPTAEVCRLPGISERIRLNETGPETPKQRPNEPKPVNFRDSM